MDRPLAYSSPFAVYLEVTNACNLHCSHCYASASSEENEKLLNLQEIFSIIDTLDSMDVIAVTLTGGEPFLRKDILKIASYASQKGMRVYLTTNGTEINEATIKELKDNGIGRITVSIEGITEHTNDMVRGKGNFRRTIEGLKLLLQHEMDVEVEITLTRHNIEEISPLIQFCKDKGVSGVQINRLVNIGKGSSLQRYTREDCRKIGCLISEISKKYGDYINPNSSLKLCSVITGKCSDDMIESIHCGAGFTICGILWNGDVVPCLLMRDIVFGNIRDLPLSEVWNSSPALKAYRSAFEDTKVKSVIPCNSCSYNDFCGRGCRAQAYKIYGTFTSPDPICETWRRTE
ncbi:MAG: radical SAM protein [Candidatus Methanofastidiosia archaeon]|jgi:radical SAM protein with 4Fe4S-binding SPASM domain